MADAERDFVEYEIDVKNGVITECRSFGEGRQVEPLSGIKVYVPAGQPLGLHRWVERFERRLKLAFGKPL